MPSGGVTPGGQVQVARVTLTSAQVLAIFTTPVALLAAPGSGRAIAPLFVIANYVAGSTAYTDNGGKLVFYSDGAHAFQSFTTAGWWDQTASQLVYVYQGGPIGPSTLSAAANTPFYVGQTVANPTLGNGTVTFTVAYLVVPVS